MKWWGWGDENVAFAHEDKPELGPLLRRHLDIDVSRIVSPPVGFDELEIPEPQLPAALRERLEAAVGPEHLSVDRLDRVVQARRKCLRELVRQRRGELGRLPDVVVRPAAEDAVERLLHAAIDSDAVVIPFGGGSNISGSLERMCLAFIGYEGSAGHISAQRRHVGRMVRRHGGLCIGSGPAPNTTRRSSTPPTSATTPAHACSSRSG